MERTDKGRARGETRRSYSLKINKRNTQRGGAQECQAPSVYAGPRKKWDGVEREGRKYRRKGIGERNHCKSDEKEVNQRPWSSAMQPSVPYYLMTCVLAVTGTDVDERGEKGTEIQG